MATPAQAEVLIRRWAFGMPVWIQRTGTTQRLTQQPGKVHSTGWSQVPLLQKLSGMSWFPVPPWVCEHLVAVAGVVAWHYDDICTFLDLARSNEKYGTPRV